MKTYLLFFFVLSINLSCFKSYAQITLATDTRHAQDSLEYVVNITNNNIQLYGDAPYLVRPDQNPRVEASGRTFTNSRNNNSFGYRINGVSNWDSDNAVSALNNGEFMAYIRSLTKVRVNKHGDFSGLKLGIGIDNGLDIDGDRNDRVGSLGEALILTFDTKGQLETDINLRLREFVPEDVAFTNDGLDDNTALVISNLHLEPGNVRANNEYRIIDYFIYDFSENAIMANDENASGLELGFATRETSGTIPGPWNLDDGDMIILAYRPPSPDADPDRVDLGRYAWGLWSLKMDLINKSNLSSDSSNSNPTSMLYPNPISSEVNIKLNKTYQNISVKLYSTDGRVILSHNYLSRSELSINMESLKSGHYLLRLHLDHKTSTLKIIKH